MGKKKLTGKQQAFVDFYLQHFNATKAAEQAGYKGNGKTLAQVGAENLRKPYLQQAIAKRTKSRAMDADEALSILAEMARADLGDFLHIDHNYTIVDLEQAKKDGKTHLIKSYQGASKIAGAKVELHDKQRAIENILKALGVFNHKQQFDFTGKIEIDYVNDWRKTSDD